MVPIFLQKRRPGGQVARLLVTLCILVLAVGFSLLRSMVIVERSLSRDSKVILITIVLVLTLPILGLFERGRR